MGGGRPTIRRKIQSTCIASSRHCQPVSPFIDSAAPPCKLGAEQSKARRQEKARPRQMGSGINFNIRRRSVGSLFVVSPAAIICVGRSSSG